MTNTILASVGKYGVNNPNDVKIIQDLLNNVPASYGCTFAPLKVDGLCWNLTLTAIGMFQKNVCGFLWPDQLIEPAGRTIIKLLDVIGLVGGGTCYKKPPAAVTFPHFGVDSQIPADWPHYCGGAYYDVVKNRLDACYRKHYERPAPGISFWGRYIGGAQPLTNAEVADLHKRNCKILVIFNGIKTNNMKYGYSAGQDDANRANADKIHVPTNVTIYANVDEKMQPPSDWYRGWITEMISLRGTAGVYLGSYKGGAYCNAFGKLSQNIQNNVNLMLAYNVTTPGCHNGGSHIKQDSFNYPICMVSGGNQKYAGVDIDSSDNIGFSHMW